MFSFMTEVHILVPIVLYDQIVHFWTEEDGELQCKTGNWCIIKGCKQVFDAYMQNSYSQSYVQHSQSFPVIGETKF